MMGLGRPDTSAHREAIIENIKAVDAAWVRMGNALTKYLSLTFGHFPEARELADSIVAIANIDSPREIAELSQPLPAFPSYGPNPTAVLARLVEDRDRVAAQIDQAMQGVEALRKADNGDGLSNIFEAGVIGPLRGVLAQIEEQISRVQESMEGELDGPTTTE